MQKYIFISGGIISGLGKGITSASIALLLQSSGYKVVTVKCENYLNVDAGTINPIEHGDPFLCEDGLEADMDIGTYEKFLGQDMGKPNFMTMGSIYQKVIEKERRFEYEGEDVQEVVHITGEIIDRINRALKVTKSDIAVIELGGTAGEYQNILYYEASRMLSFKSPGQVIHVHVSYVPTPKHLGEPKTKPVQLSVRTVNSMGIQPDMLVVRSEEPIDKRRKERLALFCSVHAQDVFSSYDVPSVYEVPLILEAQGISIQVCEKLGLKYKKPKLDAWKKMVVNVKTPKKNNVKIAIVGKYFKTGDYKLKDSYAALFDAIDHASLSNNVESQIEWVSAEDVEKMGIDKIKELKEVDGIIVPIGWGERGIEGMIEAASYARREKIPYLGLCYGMQIAVIAYAREMLGWKDAHTEEVNSKTKHPVIHLMSSQKYAMERRSYGGTMRLGAWEAIVKKGTLAWDSYSRHNGFINKKTGLTSERHRHRYEFNDEYAKDFERAGLVISARSKVEHLAEIIELPKSVHPFYLGTQGHPEYKSRPLSPHPLFLDFIKSCIKQSIMVK